MLIYAALVVAAQLLGTVLLFAAARLLALALPRSLYATIEWKWSDKWVGLYHKASTRQLFGFRMSGVAQPTEEIFVVTAWICLFPCLPVRLEYSRTRPAPSTPAKVRL